MESAIKIVVIEDHALIRSLIERVAADAFEDAAIAGAGEGREGVGLCRTGQPDLVLLDLELPDAEGFDLVGQIRSAAPGARILVLSAHTEAYILHRVQQAQVDGFVDKNEQTPEVLIEALRRVSQGMRYFSPSIVGQMARTRSDPQGFSRILSPREQELLRMLGQGWTDATIADRVGLSELTVRNHRRNIMAKLGLHSTPELVRYAIEHGFSRVRKVEEPGTAR